MTHSVPKTCPHLRTLTPVSRFKHIGHLLVPAPVLWLSLNGGGSLRLIPEGTVFDDSAGAPRSFVLSAYTCLPALSRLPLRVAAAVIRVLWVLLDSTLPVLDHENGEDKLRRLANYRQYEISSNARKSSAPKATSYHWYSRLNTPHFHLLCSW